MSEYFCVDIITFYEHQVLAFSSPPPSSPSLLSLPLLILSVYGCRRVWRGFHYRVGTRGAPPSDSGASQRNPERNSAPLPGDLCGLSLSLPLSPLSLRQRSQSKTAPCRVTIRPRQKRSKMRAGQLRPPGPRIGHRDHPPPLPPSTVTATPLPLFFLFFFPRSQRRLRTNRQSRSAFRDLDGRDGASKPSKHA